MGIKILRGEEVVRVGRKDLRTRGAQISPSLVVGETMLHCSPLRRCGEAETAIFWRALWIGIEKASKHQMVLTYDR